MQKIVAEQVQAIRRLRSVMNRFLAELGKKLGVNSTDLLALSHLIDSHSEGRVLTPRELGEWLSLSGPAMTSVLDRLQQRGWLYRRRDEADGRKLQIHLTEDVLADPVGARLGGLYLVVSSICQKYDEAEINKMGALLHEISDGLESSIKNFDDLVAQSVVFNQPDSRSA